MAKYTEYFYIQRRYEDNINYNNNGDINDRNIDTHVFKRCTNITQV